MVNYVEAKAAVGELYTEMDIITDKRVLSVIMKQMTNIK